VPLHSTGRVWEEDVREAVCEAEVLMSRKLHVLIRTDDPQHDPHRNRESTARRITHDLRRGKLVIPPASLKFAPACREHVLHPFRLAAVGERDNEAVRRSKNIHWRPVDFAGLSSDVGQDAEARKPACEKAGDPVGEGNVDLRQPSLAKPHHENA
jgi:hypothetical protein